MLLLLTFIALVSPGHAQTEEMLENQIRSTQDVKERRDLYLKLLDQLQQRDPRRDAWCREFLNDMKRNNDYNGIALAARETNFSPDMKLIEEAIDAMKGLPRLTPFDQNVLLTLRCQLFSYQEKKYTKSERNSLHTQLIRELNSPTIDKRSIYEQYYLNYQEHVIHTHMTDIRPLERVADRLVKLSLQMEARGFDTPLHMALDIQSDMNLYNCRYQSCLHSDSLLIERIKKTQEAYKRMGREEPNFQFYLYTIYNRMLVCHFVLNHEIKEEYYQLAMQMRQERTWLANLPASRFHMMPIFILVHEGDIPNAFLLHKSVLDEIKGKGEDLHDYEYDMCSWFDMKRGNLQRALEIIEEQDQMLTNQIQKFSEN